MNQPKVLMAMPCVSGMVPLPTVESMLKLHKPCACAFIAVERQRIDRVRSYFAKQAISGEFDYLFMVDDDNPIPPDTLELMLSDDKDIVIAPILTRNPNPSGKHDLCAYYRTDIKIGGDGRLPYYSFAESFRDDGPLHRMDAGGTGCMLVKTRVLQVLAAKYETVFEFGDVTVNGQRRTTSEDVEFCERATNAGFEVWLDERIRPLHLTRQSSVQWQLQEAVNNG
jgi:hypothetical protein